MNKTLSEVQGAKTMNLRGRSMATLMAYSKEEILHILNVAVDIKRRFKAGETYHPMKGKMMAMIFQKPSLRTRVSFETGMFQLGGAAMYISPNEIGMGKRESVEDVAKVLSSMVDIIMARVFGHDIIEDLVKYSDVPVINGLSDFSHPCQALADYQTIMERGKAFQGLKLAFIGDGNNVANSLVFGGLPLGVDVWVASPKGYELDEKVQKWAKEYKGGGSLTVTTDYEKAAKDADVFYSDVWASMGQEEEAEKRKKAFKGYQINSKLMKLAKPDAIVLHCLPAHYDEEITHEVAHGPQSAIWQQAENRLHAQKALIALLAG
ncbi:MAG: ornithine carbamoyltransferase [Elusimicrobiota bacterium]